MSMATAKNTTTTTTTITITKLLGFSSGSSAPLRQLSNLADAPFTLTWPADLYGVPDHMRGTTARYDTAEHAYQALLSLDAATAREFEAGGRVSMAVFRAFPACKSMRTRDVLTDFYERKEGYWGAQKGCRGIAPKMVANLPRDVAAKALGLRLAPRHAPIDTYEQQRALWRPIHAAKFAQNARLATVLRATAPARLVEAGRFRQSGQYWSAFIDGPHLIGHNVMGRILTDLRDALP